MPANKQLHSAIAQGESIALPGLVITEILAGLKNDAEAEHIADLLGAFEWVAEFSSRDYSEAARIYRLCRSKGFTVRSMIDCLIAQACLRDSQPLLGKNRDFKTIAACLPLHLVMVDLD